MEKLKLTAGSTEERDIFVTKAREDAEKFGVSVTVEPLGDRDVGPERFHK